MENSDSPEGHYRPSSRMLTSTVFGEYLTLLLVLHALLIALGWAPLVGQSDLAGMVVVSAIWVIGRAMGVGANRGFASVATLVLLGAWVWGVSGSLVGGVRGLSIAVLIVMIAVISWLDVAEFQQLYLVNSDGRKQLRDFVLRHGLRILLYGVLALISIYGLAIPLVQEWQFQGTPVSDEPLKTFDRMTLSENILFSLCESVTAFFFFVFGACVGSFLNVVIYRVPLGISVLVKPSHCPGCSEKINGQDNLPLIGWLKLKACCRNCGISVSSRYPAIELTIGLVFLNLFFVELISGGANLPGRPPSHYAGVQWILFYTKWDLVGLYFYHCLLICTLFSWAMIERDGHRVPLASVFLTFCLLAIPLFIWPHLLPYPAAADASGGAQSYSAAGAAVTAGLGLVAGSCVAVIVRLTSHVIQPIPGSTPSWLLLGMALGWQACVGVFILVLVWQLLCLVHRSVFNIDSKQHDLALRNCHLVLPWILFVHHCTWRIMIDMINGV